MERRYVSRGAYRRDGVENVEDHSHVAMKERKAFEEVRSVFKSKGESIEGEALKEVGYQFAIDDNCFSWESNQKAKSTSLSKLSLQLLTPQIDLANASFQSSLKKSSLKLSALLA